MEEPEAPAHWATHESAAAWQSGWRAGRESANGEELTNAAARLSGLLRMKIGGMPHHPWIPGAAFADGHILQALEALEEKL
jgi:hypothetical protein